MVELPESEYRAIFERAVEGIFRTTVDGRIELVNPSLAKIAGHESPEAFLRSPTNVRDLYVDPAERDELIAKLATDGFVSDFEVQLRRPDGTVAWGSISARALTDEAGRMTGVEGSIIDVSEKREAQTKLRAAEAKYRGLIEQIPAIVYTAELGEEDAWSYVSPQVETVLGFKPEEWLADRALFIRQLHPNDRRRVVTEKRRLRERVAAGDTESAVLEYRMLARNGRALHMHDTVGPVKDEMMRPLFFQGVMVDVTEVKLREQSLRESYELLRMVDGERRQLLTRLVKAQEEERRRVATEVHDGVNQALVSALYRMRACEDALPPGEIEDLTKAIALVDEALRESWRIIRGLRPRPLDDLGLGPSLGMLARRTLAGQVELELELEESLALSAEQEVTLYRIAQEALSNVRKHAQASHVRVSLRRHDDGIVLSISDDGIGFYAKGRDETFGLEGMSERASLVGGRVSVWSEPGQGTVIEAQVPVPGSAA